MRGHEGNQYIHRLATRRKHRLALAIGVLDLAADPKNAMRAIVHDIFHDAYESSLALVFTVQAATDQIDPIVFIFVGLRKLIPRHPYRISLERLGLISIAYAFELGHDMPAMEPAGCDAYCQRRRQSARTPWRDGRSKPPCLYPKQGVAVCGMRLHFDPAAYAIGRYDAPEFDKVGRHRYCRCAVRRQAARRIA